MVNSNIGFYYFYTGCIHTMIWFFSIIIIHAAAQSSFALGESDTTTACSFNNNNKNNFNAVLFSSKLNTEISSSRKNRKWILH